jgi:anti-sigma B factor antagonist
MARGADRGLTLAKTVIRASLVGLALGRDHVNLLASSGLRTFRRDEMSLKIEKRLVEGVAIVSCNGRIMFGEEANALRASLKEALSNTRQLILNLSDVTYIDSGGLGTLVGVYSSARAGGADIRLTGLGQRLRDVLQITKLATVFAVYDSEQEALAALSHGAA